MEQAVLEKIAALPENLQLEVADFVHFLIQKYHLEKPDELTDEQTDEQTETTLDRHEKLNRNPGRGIDWDEAKAKLMQKYA